jgi:glucose/arabinose dehydrogenase/lysophospholipase L1-like esterase/plastocyanin
MTRLKYLLWAIALILTNASSKAADRLQLKPGDHICIVGNTLADRMQHSGWLESLLYARFPEHKLVFRNLGFSGDELTVRLRSEGFGSPDDWLKKEQADVIFAFFGYNESFKGVDGLPQFRKDLDEFIKSTLGKNYSGKGAPRLVLFSPIAAESHPDPNFRKAAELNGNLQLYTLAMGEIAKANGVPFVDLMEPSQQAYARAASPLTINGVHLTDEGYRVLAPAMFEELLGEAPPRGVDAGSLAPLRQAVNEKNAVWFSRYRTVDGYNVYGGRSYMKYNGVMNRDTMQREMEMRDVMTANRDERVWAVARGADLKVEDSNLPPPVEVTSNKPGPNPDGSYRFLSGEEAIKHMKVPPSCKVTLFASEEQFPELVNPVQMAFDTKGRLWVAAWLNYPERTPQSKKGDSLLVFEDTDGDGHADKCTPFVQDLNAPTGFQFYKDGVILVQAPEVWFLRDTDGDGRADWREPLLNGQDSADSHHTANSMVLDPGGAIYLSDGVFHRTQMETPWGPPVRNQDAAIYRFEPRSSKYETYIAYGFANPHGRAFDYWGNDFVTDATGNNTYFGPAFSGHIDYPAKHNGLREFWNRPSRPCPGTGMLSSRHFPAEFQGNFLNCNVIGFQGIFRVKVREEGSGLWGETLEPPLVVSDDPNFRPSAVDVAPDGSIYFLDWHNPIIGHLQHHLRDPSRDHAHGRIYRITYEGRPLLTPAVVAGAPIPKLLDLLKEPENNVRTRAKIELGARDTREVMDALTAWIRQFDASKVEDQHHLLEALWVRQWHNVVDEPLLRQMLRSPEPRARAQAVRVLGYWRDRVRQPLALLRVAANDPAPRVRLEAVRVASFFEGHEALDTAYDVLKYDTDYYLDYTFNETLRQLQKSEIFLPSVPKALARAVERLSDAQLKSAPDVEAVLESRLQRKGMDLNTRSGALEQLAVLHKTNRVSEAMAALRRLDISGAAPAAFSDLGILLAANPPADLVAARGALRQLSSEAKEAPVRRAALAGMLVADGKPDELWATTARDPGARVLLIDSIILLTDPSFRAMFQPFLSATIAAPKTPESVREAALRALPLMGPDNAGKSFAILAEHLRDRRNLTTAARATTQLARDSWDKNLAGPAAEAILAWAKTVPAEQRTSQDFVEAAQLGNELAGLLSPPESIRIRKELLGLGVRVLVIKTVREQMRFDTTRLVVEAGKPFEIIFENMDMMPHNLVIVQPGAREEVGTQAEKMPPQPDSKGSMYVPKNPKVFASSKLLEPQQRQTLQLTAPGKMGTYEYVCTYPEHWKTMFGELVVVKSLDEYLEANASNPDPKPQAQAVAPAHAHAHGSPR